MNSSAMQAELTLIKANLLDKYPEILGYRLHLLKQVTPEGFTEKSLLILSKDDSVIIPLFLLDGSFYTTLVSYSQFEDACAKVRKVNQIKDNLRLEVTVGPIFSKKTDWKEVLDFSQMEEELFKKFLWSASLRIGHPARVILESLGVEC